MRKLGYFLIAILAILAGIEFFLYRNVSKFTTLPQKKETSEPSALLLPSNDISFQSDDGAALHGWLIQGKVGYPAILIAHKYGSNRSLLLVKLEGLIARLNKLGYFIFLFDFRGHGQSGSTSSLGFRESQDFSAALKAVLKYRQIARRVGVLGVGMGAIAASEAFNSVDEVKCIILDSIYESIPSKYTDEIITEWPFLSFSRPFLLKGVDWNIKQILKIPTTDLALADKMPKLYPKAVIFVEKEPLNDHVKALYEAAREPKELLQMEATAEDELIGEAREKYTLQLEEMVRKYLPSVSDEKTLELSR